jgi:hypothetical protein
MTPAYGASPIKQRRTRQQMDAIRRALHAALSEYHPMTVRQVYYQMVSQGVIEKTEGEYQRTVCRLLADMRRDGSIPFGWIADNTRWMRKPRSYGSMEEALRRTAETYRRALWDHQAAYVEVWLEKDALAGVLYEETDPWDVPLMVTRGYPSLSYLYEAAETIAAVGKPVFLYYFGDYDPSGVDIPRKVEAGLREMAPGAEIHFERVAVTPEQITGLRLPTRPTKTTDSRSKDFAGESVEVDALPPLMLRRLTSNCIRRHVDGHALQMLLRTEEEERQALARILQAVATGQTIP